MPRPTTDISIYKEEILQLQARKTPIEIVQYLQTTYDILISTRTLNRRFKEWGVSTYTARLPDLNLLERLRELFFHGLNDTQILHTLKAEDHTITLDGVRRLRIQELNLKRTLRTEEERKASKEDILSELIDELQKGVITGYGRGLLYAHFQGLGVQVSRDRLFAVYRTLVPDAVDRRTRNMQRHRGEYIVPGPNFVWSLDGYLKLSPYGIEIYAAIDAYSRFIVWIYVGISSRTAVSVLRQYLDTLELLGQQPRFIRSDHGTETVLLASAHHQLQQVTQPDLQFENCYMYGTSTSNQRIESWWNQLSKGLVFRWRVRSRTIYFLILIIVQNYFHSLLQDGDFCATSLADQIALLAIYIPLLRTQMQSFVRTWNRHSIRKQPNRPNAISGKPFVLFHHSPSHVENYGLSINSDKLGDLQNDVREFGKLLLFGYIIRRANSTRYRRVSSSSYIFMVSRSATAIRIPSF